MIIETGETEVSQPLPSVFWHSQKSIYIPVYVAAACSMLVVEM